MYKNILTLRTNCESFCNMILFDISHSTQAPHTMVLGKLGPRQLGPGAQFATFWRRTVGPQATGLRGSNCHFFRADSWAPGPNLPLFWGWALGPNCPGPNCPGPNCLWPNCPGPNCPGPNCLGPNLPRTEKNLQKFFKAFLKRIVKLGLCPHFVTVLI